MSLAPRLDLDSLSTSDLRLLQENAARAGRMQTVHQIAQVLEARRSGSRPPAVTAAPTRPAATRRRRGRPLLRGAIGLGVALAALLAPSSLPVAPRPSLGPVGGVAPSPPARLAAARTTPPAPPVMEGSTALQAPSPVAPQGSAPVPESSAARHASARPQ